MPESPAVLARESAVFTRYLAGVSTTPYVTQAYARCHPTMPALAKGVPDRFDRFLVGVATAGGPFTRIADAYARRVWPTGLLRQKLVLMCAVLESSPPAHDWINTAATGSLVATVFRIGLAGVTSVLATLAGVLLLGPAHLALRGKGVAA